MEIKRPTDTGNDSDEINEDWPLIPSLLLEAAPSGWLIVDMDGQIVMVNQHVEELFGYSRSELIGSSVETLVPDALRERHVEQREAYTSHLRARRMGQGRHFLGQRKDGTTFQMEIGLSPVHTPAGDYVIAVLQDVTDLLALEEERNQFAVELEMERERQRIGMDLHDGVMQEIYAAGLTLEIALDDLGGANGHDQAGAGIERAIGQLHGVIRSIRSYIFDLRPREFSGSLHGALRNLAREFSQNSLIETDADFPDDVPEIEGDRATTVYHIAHEALSNIQKHARATHVSVRLAHEDDQLVLEVSDNGAGYDATQELPQEHRGMRNMTSRARAVGGSFDVHSVVGQGTRIRVEIPLAIGLSAPRELDKAS